ncbi:MAG: dihydrolipoamide acetyltransferase family protein [Ignavibacteriales bacterium]|nr:dihydrolipoamide acetyltransferase family protein [Ignavibacteriales bacterium]
MATKILMPKLSDTMNEGIILKWLKKEGEKVKQGETLVEIESDKADMELEAYDSGVLRKILVPDGGKAGIGAPIGIIANANEDITGLLSETPSISQQPTNLEATKKEAPTTLSSSPSQLNTLSSVTNGHLKASPLAKRLAIENKIELRSLTGSGPQGRIVKRDIEPLVGGMKTISAKVPSPIIPGGYRDIELSLIRKTIAKRMQESKQTVPHFYVTVEIDMEPAMSFREQLNAATETKISFTDILVKAIASTLMQHPNMNATYLGNTMRQFGEAHIAVAVALDEGLVTPVLRNCEQKTVFQINSELHDLAERARSRKLKPEEYQGATFTISNLGMFGVEDFVAIVNPPEGAILAVGSIVEKPVVKKGQIVVGHTMKVTLSSDHRIIDGAVAARFLHDLKILVEKPIALML